MQRKDSIRVDRYLNTICDENNHLPFTYEQIAASVSIDLGIDLSYSEAKDAVAFGEFTCDSTRGFGNGKSKSLTFTQFREANIQRLHSAEKFSQCKSWSSDQWLKAFIGEVGELCNFDKKVDRGDYTSDTVRPEIEAEFADIMAYLDIWAWSKGVNLERVTREKFNEVSDRVGSEVKL